jgi:hypothetical protein
MPITRAVAAKLRTGRVRINGAPLDKRGTHGGFKLSASAANGAASASRNSSNTNRSWADGRSLVL